MASILIAKEAANVIHTIAISSKKKYKQVWSTAIKFLIELDKKAYEKDLEDLNFTTTSYIASFPVRYARTGPDDWESIKNHFFEYFRKALHKGRIKLERASSHTEIDYLSAMSSLLFAVSQGGATDEFKWTEVSEKIISEFEVAMKEPRLRERYSPQAVFALIYNVLTDKLIVFGRLIDEGIREVISGLEEFVKATYDVPKDKLHEKTKSLLDEYTPAIKSLKYSLKTTPKNPNDVLFNLDKIKEGFNKQ